MLTLQITPWNTDAVWDTSLGDQPHFSVIGSWEISGWTTDVGGYFTPQIKLDSCVYFDSEGRFVKEE